MRKKGLITFLLYFIVIILVQFLVVLIDIKQELTLLTLLISNLIVLVIGFSINSKDIIYNIKKYYNKRSTYKSYGFGMFIYIITMIIVGIIASIYVNDSNLANQVAIEEAFKNSNIIISFLVITIIGPITEELVFRYSVINLFDVNLKLLRWVPYLLSILLFALIHEYHLIFTPNLENFIKFLIYAAPATVIVIVYALSKRNFLTVCLLHMTINFISLLGMSLV